jgi:hypothetical protein
MIEPRDKKDQLLMEDFDARRACSSKNMTGFDFSRRRRAFPKIHVGASVSTRH